MNRNFFCRSGKFGISYKSFLVVLIILVFSVNEGMLLAAPGSVSVIQTSQAGDRLASKAAMNFIADDGSVISTINVFSGATYQKIIGFGGAFTESSAYVLSHISAAKRTEVLNAYFSPNGSGYSLMRTHINSCDFSLSSYSYDDVSGDTNLNNFNIAPDTGDLIPLIKDAMAVPGASFKLFASPWSPPAWMKSNGSMCNGGSLNASCYSAWALYFSKYIQAYAAQGIPIWAVTMQNEPEAVSTWENCVYTPAQERDFVKNYLGPRFTQDGITAKIMVYDHNKNDVFTYANTILSDALAAQYSWGVAIHWYDGDHFDNVLTTHNTFPNTHILHTEGCQDGGVHLNEWAPAEKYGHDIIGDMNVWTEAWVDWNIVLDQNGGPNHVGNYCSAPIIANTSTGTLTYNPSYYYLAHFSKYVRPDAYRIGINSNDLNLETTAFKNTDGNVVVVVMNKTANAITFKLKDGSYIIKPTIPAHAIMNFIYSGSTGSTAGLYEAEGGTLSGGASNVSDSAASGGYRVDNLHSQGASVMISSVNGGAGGNATLTINYATLNTDPKLSLYVNGTDVAQLTFSKTGGWTMSNPGQKSVTINLNAGSNNTVKLQMDSNDTVLSAINVDSFVIGPTTTPTPTPASTPTPTPTPTPGGPAGYTWCANEGGTYTLNGTCDVAYGANGSFYYLYGRTGSITFNNTTFGGDPCPNVVKAGYYKSSGVTFYQNADYGGTASQVFAKGTYTMAQMNAKGVPNDWMSSLKVPSGWTVIVYQNDNCTGTSWTFTADTNYVGAACNDQMTSCKIQ